MRTSAVGTVAYVDGDRVWVFGHQLEGVGRRALLLQDAYVFRIVNNPLALGQIGTTYKLGVVRARPRDGQLGRVQRASRAAPARSRTRSRCR